MNVLQVAGKYLDQPRLVGKFSKAVPALLIGGGAAFTINHVRKTPKQERQKEFIKSACVLTATITSALLAPKIAGKLFPNSAHGLSEKVDLKELAQNNTELIDDFLKNNRVTKEIGDLLEKAKTKILNFSQVKTLFEAMKGKKSGKELLKNLIPDPENVDSEHIFGEIGRLSVMGFVPVVGGIAGGITGDRLTEKNWKDKIPNKIKEGSYQYLANIFLCNIGAGAALTILEKAKVNSKAAKAAGMILGILTVGIIGGSAIANLIGKIFVDPLLAKRGHGHHHGIMHIHGRKQKNKENCEKEKGLYSERKPEALDMGLHIDDIASVAVLSGLKWIEPVLPVLYSISGYRAGIGYRNGEED